MEIDIEERLEVARQNVATLQVQLDTATQEASRLNMLLTKWLGVIDYLESLKLETLNPEDDGHGEKSAIPEEKSKGVKT